MNIIKIALKVAKYMRLLRDSLDILDEALDKARTKGIDVDDVDKVLDEVRAFLKVMPV